MDIDAVLDNNGARCGLMTTILLEKIMKVLNFMKEVNGSDKCRTEPIGKRLTIKKYGITYSRASAGDGYLYCNATYDLISPECCYLIAGICTNILIL